MLIPIRCFSCNKCIAQLHKRFIEMKSDGVEPEQALDRLNVRRVCCRRMLITSVSTIDISGQYVWGDRRIQNGSTEILTTNRTPRTVANIK